MERKIYPENFENYLKRQADEFKMVPSKKVWRGIYNNIRPGARWPSITMSMVFIFALVIVGHLNSNKNYYKYKNGLTELNSLALKNRLADNKNNLTAASNSRIKNNFFNNEIQATEEQGTENTDITTDKPATTQNLQPNDEQELSGSKNKQPAEVNKTTSIENPGENNVKTTLQDNTLPPATNETDNTVIKNQPSIINDQKAAIEKKQNQDEDKIVSEKEATATLRKQRKSSAELLYYLTPAISYRAVGGNDWMIVHRPMIGLEGGTSIGYKLSKHFAFTTGIQLNYSGYYIRSVMSHPSIATVTLNNGEQTYSVTGMSQYTNQPGNNNNNINLKNYSLQTSIPIGVQYTFTHNGDISFSAAASIQPFFVIANREYLLSSNGRNYITDPDLVRKWNMSSTFGTYISFKSNTLNWQIGPQVRYQLLSSFTNDYQFKENLIDFGIRFGISRIIK